jgi:hypothetical protein
MRTMENMIHAAIEAAIECPNMSREGLVQNIIDRIHVALIAAVYAGHIEGDERVVPKFNGIGADSYQHREEYMNYAAKFDFPRNSEGKIESDTVFNEVSDYMWRNYCDPQVYQPLYTPTCPHGYEDCVYDPAYIKKHYPEWYEDLGCPTTCENCPAGERYDDEDK